jgi:hypothetical protein
MMPGIISMSVSEYFRKLNLFFESGLCIGLALMDMDDERGAIKTGYQVDIIATKRNPLDDIPALEQVIFVMKAGIVYKGPGASAD